jgi:adenylosuccinate lyase
MRSHLRLVLASKEARSEQQRPRRHNERIGTLPRTGDGVQVLAEPIQTVMRKYAVAEPYEKLKEFTRGNAVTAESMQQFVDKLEGVPDDVKAQMRQWTPSNYIGNAAQQARDIRKFV